MHLIMPVHHIMRYYTISNACNMWVISTARVVYTRVIRCTVYTPYTVWCNYDLGLCRWCIVSLGQDFFWYTLSRAGMAFHTNGRKGSRRWWLSRYSQQNLADGISSTSGEFCVDCGTHTCHCCSVADLGMTSHVVCHRRFVEG